MRHSKTLERMAVAGLHGATWYETAAKDIRRMARRSPWTVKRITDVVALMSPRCAVRRNIRVALAYLADGSIARDVLPSVARSLEVYEATGVIHGVKTGPFARALRGDPSAIVIDSWMADAMGFSRNRVAKHIGQAEQRIETVAESLGLSPAATQAAIWTHARDCAGFSFAGFPIIEEYDAVS